MRFYSGNSLVDQDDSDHPFSPNYRGVDKSKICKECNGEKFTIELDYIVDCCGKPEENGNCCNELIQRPIQVQIECKRCNGTGKEE